MKLEDKKRMAAKAFAAFFILMAAAGGLSRAAASMTVPIADTQKYQSGRLNLNLTGTAVVETKEENLVSLVKEQRVLSTARIGTQVEQGDVLLQYDTQYLQKAIEEKQAEVKKLELSLEQARLQGEPQERVAAADSAARDLDLANQSLAQAQSDYDQAFSDSQNAQSQAQSNYDNGLAAAAQTKEESYNQAQELETQAQELEAQGETENAQSLYAEAESLRQEADQTYEAAASQAQSEYEAAVSQAQASLEEAEASLNAQTQSQAQAQNAYTSAQEEDAAAAANDQKTQAESSYNQQSIQVDLDLAKKELSDLEKLQQSNGQVTASKAGVVTGMNVQTGGITDDSSYLLLGTGGLQIKGSLQTQDLEKVEAEDTVEISVSGQGKKIQGKVTQVGAGGDGQLAEAGSSSGTSEESQDMAGYFYADIEERAASWGTQVSYSIDKQSGSSYEMLIPLGAVREDAQGTYCLIAESRETVLGTEYRAARVNITVEDKDSTQAAVTGNLGKDDLIISGSTKDIAERDKVRLRDE